MTLADMVIKISGKKISKTYDLSAPQGVRGRNADLTLVKKVLKWEPQVSLEDGLAKTYSWIEEQVAIRQATKTYKGYFVRRSDSTLNGM